MATRNVSKQASALAKAKERRRVLDKARDDQDRWVEEATAAAMVAMEQRAEVERALEGSTGQVGEALKVLMAEDVPVERAAALLEVDAAEVRRLIKAAPAESTGPDAGLEAGTKATVSVLPDLSGGEGAARRAG